MTALVAPVSVGRFLVTSDYGYYGGSRVFDRNIIIALGLRSHPSITYVCLSSCGGVLDNCVHVGFRQVVGADLVETPISSFNL
ncbi:hypothetical protein Bca52824_044224 [Brassica carinata]|uniref:Uncharacterized protein n=1 Tax=Brassica carinata TaxID=52824 RepID=A0A8X7UZ28_BRACI|nr:hypothetical protein Bca52824_044224 [Brassica carinata]